MITMSEEFLAFLAMNNASQHFRRSIVKSLVGILKFSYGAL